MGELTEDIHVVIITGMSGAGKTVAVQSFEDLGFYCVDNLPPALIPTFIELIENSGGKMNKVALVIDLRGREFFDHLFEAVDHLRLKSNLSTHILFLDAKDDVLVQRYKETRRSHPLAAEETPLEGINQEREILEDLKGRARQIIDTSELKPKQLRERIIQFFSGPEKDAFSVNIMSFGYKYGLPIDADLVFDVRFLPNPHYIESLKPKTGLEEEVSSYVLKWAETKEFTEKLLDMLNYMLPQYKREGKSQLIIAIGCTGGKHRSVTLAEHVADYFAGEYATHKSHRDIEKGKE
ncbi:RNase adapter RapZ [Salibacterium salarium]|uniref:RNase adapter RapZ n=1 Tax=Salibacterium salarium TaxID=284579 RepID=A0A3R9P4A4_9BACI|nr:RNase adapter RapZ [Salibacterium salarium]RSL30758.1 RNase adapter RapZ [Salibacterium salarium]